MIIEKDKVNKDELLKELAFRFNLCSMYELNNVCSMAEIQPVKDIKYARHNGKSYMDMKKKHIRKEAMQERLAAQREIIKLLGECDTGTVEYVASDVYRHLRADGYKLN